MKNQILFDKSALLTIAEALGFTVEKGILMKDGKYFLDSKNKKVSIFQVVGFKKNKIYLKIDKKIEEINL